MNSLMHYSHVFRGCNVVVDTLPVMGLNCMNGSLLWNGCLPDFVVLLVSGHEHPTNGNSLSISKKKRQGAATATVSWVGLIICLVGSGLDRVISGFGSKNIDSCSAHDMVESGRIWVGSGWPTISCVIFGLDWVFFSFGPNISARTRHVTWSGRIESGFFQTSWVGFIESGGPWSGLLPRRVTTTSSAELHRAE